MQGINWLAIAVAALSSFVLGGLWYSPLLFGKAWMRATGHTQESLKGGNMGLIFGLSFVLALIAAAVFALFLGPRPAFGFATGAGVAAGLGWIAPRSASTICSNARASPCSRSTRAITWCSSP